MTAVPIVPGLPLAEYETCDDVDLVHLDLRSAISSFIRSHPRSLQKHIGPSEVGTPCLRKLAYKLSTISEPAGYSRLAWRPAVGTAVHSYLEKALNAYNQATGETRYLTEQSVECGHIDGQPLTGSVDVYDVRTATVVDFKVVGPTSLKKARASGVSELYRTQVHLYGLGFSRAGWPVDNVAILFLPSAGEITEAVFWSEPHNPELAQEAINRADAIAVAVRLLGPDAVIPGLARADDWCQSCPWYQPGVAEGFTPRCPGAIAPRSSDIDMILGPQ